MRSVNGNWTRPALLVIGFAMVGLLPHERYVFPLAMACACVGVPITMDYEMSLLIPAVRKELGGICIACGYDLRGNVSGTCPECGHKIEKPQPAAASLGPKAKAGRNYDGLGMVIFGVAVFAGIALAVFGHGEVAGVGALIAGMSSGGVFICLKDLANGSDDNRQ